MAEVIGLEGSYFVEAGSEEDLQLGEGFALGAFSARVEGRLMMQADTTLDGVLYVAADQDPMYTGGILAYSTEGAVAFLGERVEWYKPESPEQ